jgi:hypothetical protein
MSNRYNDSITPPQLHSNKEIKNETRRNFLLTFFNPEPKYQVKEINGFVLVKYHDNSTDRWGVMIYTPENWKKVEEYKSLFGIEKPMVKGNQPQDQVSES